MFLNGMRLIFTEGALPKWNGMAERTVPGCRNRISIFEYDWFGRVEVSDMALSLQEGR